MVARLLTVGADMGLKNGRGWTALHSAALDRPEVLQFFLQAGADPTIRE